MPSQSLTTNIPSYSKIGSQKTNCNHITDPTSMDFPRTTVLIKSFSYFSLMYQWVHEYKNTKIHTDSFRQWVSAFMMRWWLCSYTSSPHWIRMPFITKTYGNHKSDIFYSRSPFTRSCFVRCMFCYTSLFSDNKLRLYLTTDLFMHCVYYNPKLSENFRGMYSEDTS